MLPISMTDDKNKISNELIYRTLVGVQERITEMDARLTSSIRVNSGKLSAIENILAGFHQSLHIRDQELDQHRGRLEALEHDDPKP